MAAQTLILQNSALLQCLPPRATALSRPPTPTTVLFKPRAVSFQSTPTPYPSLPFSLRNRNRNRNPVSSRAVRACFSTAVHAQSPTPSLLTGSTRTVTTLLAIALTASKLLAEKILNFAQSLKGFQGGLPQSIINSAGPAFFAAIGDQDTGSLNTPFTVVAAGMAKWLDIYSGVLMVRVLLSWFPNIPWDRQPFSAVRDLCDPYLNLFRNIIPPIFDTLDVSPLLAFAVLGTLGSILKSSQGGF